MKMLDDIEEIYELTPLQQGMLFHSLYAPESSVYNIQVEFALEGDLDEAALEKAWRSVVERYAPLRTSFVWERVEKPYQVVHRRADLKIARHDWRALSAVEQDERKRSLPRRGSHASVRPDQATSDALGLDRPVFDAGFDWSGHSITSSWKAGLPRSF